MLVVVLSDTHLRDRPHPGAPDDRGLPPRAVEQLARADLILHCGDVVEPGLLDALARYAPVHAVLGNNDGALRGRLPEQLVVEAEGVRIGMIHDAGPTKGRAARVHRRFPDCAVVVFGHSHSPVNEAGIEGQWLLNPGSPTQRRRAPAHTVGLLELRGRAFWRAELVTVTQAPS